jgi:phosphatidylinositol alpha-1,6-mannosyltransferase
MSRLIFAAQLLTPGSGGIAQVGRLCVKALHDRLNLALAAEDRTTHDVAGVPVRGFSGRRLAFVARNNYELLRGAHALYDYAGTGRANLLPKHYALWVHGTEFWTGPQLRPDHMRVIRRATCVLLNSHYTARGLDQALGPLAQAQVCWLGTEDDDAPPSPACDGPPTVLFIGRSDEFFAKGQDILVKVWPAVVSTVKDARLCFVGGGVRLAELKKLAAASSAAANIDVLGFQSEAQVQRIWQHATVFALLGNLEGFGLVVVEAMRHSVPVVTSTNDAACEVNVDAVTGYNVDRGDETGIVDRLVMLLRNRDHARTMGIAGFHRWQEHFCFSVFRKRFLAAVGPWLRGLGL